MVVEPVAHRGDELEPVGDAEGVRYGNKPPPWHTQPSRRRPLPRRVHDAPRPRDPRGEQRGRAGCPHGRGLTSRSTATRSPPSSSERPREIAGPLSCKQPVSAAYRACTNLKISFVL